MVGAETAEDAAKVLFECGYSETVLTTEPSNIDKIIRHKRIANVTEFKEFCDDENLKQVVFTYFDYHNATVYYKHRVLGEEIQASIYPFGNVDERGMNLILQKRYDILPECLQIILKELDFQDSEGRTPTAIEIESKINNAKFCYILRRQKKIRNKDIKNYYMTEIDLLNIKNTIKIRNMGGSLNTVLICGGHIGREYLEKMLHARNTEAVKSCLVGMSYDYKELSKDVERAIETGDMLPLEVAINKFLMKTSMKGADDLFSINMSFGYFIHQMNELKTVKTILVFKKLGFSPEFIREQLGGTYDFK